MGIIGKISKMGIIIVEFSVGLGRGLKFKKDPLPNPTQ